MFKSVTNSTTLLAGLRESSVVKESSALTQHNGISVPPFAHTHTSFLSYSAFFYAN